MREEKEREKKKKIERSTAIIYKRFSVTADCVCQWDIRYLYVQSFFSVISTYNFLGIALSSSIVGFHGIILDGIAICGI